MFFSNFITNIFSFQPNNKAIITYPYIKDNVIILIPFLSVLLDTKYCNTKFGVKFRIALKISKIRTLKNSVLNDKERIFVLYKPVKN